MPLCLRKTVALLLARWVKRCHLIRGRVEWSEVIDGGCLFALAAAVAVLNEGHSIGLLHVDVVGFCFVSKLRTMVVPG